jgi:4-carboxymuconolactone decarboxylase
MRLKQPRVPVLPESEWDDDTRERLEKLRRNGQVFNIFKTLARHKQLFSKWLVFAGHTLSQSTLPARDREIVILRMGWLSRAAYEWGHHKAIGKQIGLSDEDFDNIQSGSETPGIDPFEATLLRAVDELNTDTFISDETWSALAERYDTQQMLDLIFTAGQYKLVSMVLNSTGIQLEDGFEGFSDETQG